MKEGDELAESQAWLSVDGVLEGVDLLKSIVLA